MKDKKAFFSILIMLAAFILVPGVCAGQDESYPLRALFPEVPYITTQDLIERYDQCVIMDIRTSFEYDVAHINSAHLLPLDSDDFSKHLVEIRPKDDPRPLVFYCNGHTCQKSYDAARLAISLSFKNVMVYDGGIFDWIVSKPDLATLMGATPARKTEIIPDHEFEKRLVSFEQIKSEDRDQAVVIDIRDPFQRKQVPALPNIVNIPLDPLLKLVRNRIWTEKRLIIFDAVGKQVRWLQYYLKHYGYYNYVFLRDGVLAISDDTALVRPVVASTRKIRAFQDALRETALNWGLASQDKSLLLYILGVIKFNNYAAIENSVLAEEFGLSEGALKNSLDRLAREKCLTYKQLGGSFVIQVNPRLGWKGSVEGDIWREKLAEFEQPSSEEPQKDSQGGEK